MCCGPFSKNRLKDMTNQLVDLYIVYQIVKKLVTPFEDTEAYKLGIIDKDGNVLRPRKTLTKTSEKDAWTWMDIMLNNIKRALMLVPGGKSKFFSYAAAYFMLREPVQKLQEMAHLEGKVLIEEILGPQSDNYLMEAIDLTEDAITAAPGIGTVASAGMGPVGDYGRKMEIPEKFAGCKVFTVDSDTFQKCRFGKKKYARYEQYVGNSPLGLEIKEYGKKHRKRGIILMDNSTGVMFYLRRPTPPM